jgi:hypothetical protein
VNTLLKGKDHHPLPSAVDEKRGLQKRELHNKVYGVLQNGLML